MKRVKSPGVLARKTLMKPLVEEVLPKAKKRFDKMVVKYMRVRILSIADLEFKKLLKRKDIRQRRKMIKLLGEIAVLRAIVKWHERQENLPSKPRIKRLK